MRSSVKVIMLSVIAMLAVAGVSGVLMNRDGTGGSGVLANEAPLVAVERTADGEAISVTTNVSGQIVPLEGVRVVVCRMGGMNDSDRSVLRVREAVTLCTGEDGRVMYNFCPGEKYMILAEDRDQRGFAFHHMDGTEASYCHQHQWNWQHIEELSLQCKNELAVCPTEPSSQRMAGELDRDRDRDCTCPDGNSDQDRTRQRLGR